ncbi:MAG: hypothetical protein ABJN69_10425 [Hellea sp.]
MIFPFGQIAWLAVIAAGLLSACKTTGPTEAKPALIAKTNQAVQDTLTLAVSKAVGSKVTLAPNSFTSSPSVTIEPSSVNKRNGQIIDGRSQEMPTHIDLIMMGSACFVMNRGTGEKYPLKGVSCKPAP